MQKTIGGDRLGAGKNQKVELHNYERSTHDLSYIWRSTMAAGTLVPFLTEVALPGDTFDIDLNADIKTHPTIGPLFGSFKVQLDVFVAPIRLYQGQLHNNKLGIGLDMSKIKLPQVELWANAINYGKNPDNQQINPSCIFSYLNIRGLGKQVDSNLIKREFNAIPYLMYWDVYKNYYANKQEEKGAVIHTKIPPNVETIDYINVITTLGENTLPEAPEIDSIVIGQVLATNIKIPFTGTTPIPEQIQIATSKGYFILSNLFNDIQVVGTVLEAKDYIGTNMTLYNWSYLEPNEPVEKEPEVYMFDLSEIDEMRESILAATKTPTRFLISRTTNAYNPYNLPLQQPSYSGYGQYPKLCSQEGLAIKTYQSDLFNNWISTEWIDGDNGVNAITAIDTGSGSFTIDTLNLSKKVYDMLNRIAISGGSYDDWIDAVYTHDRYRRAESPMYMGGLSKELVFQEVVSNAASATGDDQPLGTLAGKGVMAGKHKGGSVVIKIDEPSYIMGIISLTPRIDYSQGNKWDVNLQTMNDLHKPALDQIGFQDLITDQMAWWDTAVDSASSIEFKSAGKQPAWVNYMTNVNQVRGNFAIEENEMFMTLNRRYETNVEGDRSIKDLTTYIDPVKFNHIFAQTARDAQNYWAQISVDITARRKMSAKIMPNL